MANEKKEELGYVTFDSSTNVSGDSNGDVLSLSWDVPSNQGITDTSDSNGGLVERSPEEIINRISNLINNLMETRTKDTLVDATIRNTVRLFANEVYGTDDENAIEFEDLSQFVNKL